jgi:hypothetical protein
MSDSIAKQLREIKADDKDLHSHIKKFISEILLDRANLTAFEAYSVQQRIGGGVTECVFKVREAYSHLRDY